MQPLYLCADIGGTRIKTALLAADGQLAGAIFQQDACAALERDALLDHIAACLLAPVQAGPGKRPCGVRLAMPGPCDYEAGICKIAGLAKYGALYNVDLRAALGRRLAPALGGALAPEGTPGMPPGGYLYPLPLRGKRVDDWVSRRGLQALSAQTLGEALDGLPLAQRATAGDAGAQAVWRDFGALLAEVLTPALDAYRPQLCCLGGQVTASAPLFLAPLAAACRARGIALACTQDTSLRAMQGTLPA